jgi:hypothetical protein
VLERPDRVGARHLPGGQHPAVAVRWSHRTPPRQRGQRPARRRPMSFMRWAARSTVPCAWCGAG